MFLSPLKVLDAPCGSGQGHVADPEKARSERAVTVVQLCGLWRCKRLNFFARRLPWPGPVPHWKKIFRRVFFDRFWTEAGAAYGRAAGYGLCAERARRHAGLGPYENLSAADSANHAADQSRPAQAATQFFFMPARA